MNSNKKKTAIIVGSVATALLASAAIATALYLRGKNKLDKPKDKTTFIDFGISKEDQKEFGAHDAKVEEEFKKIRKYIEKIIENLNKGINEAKKDLSIQDYNVLINYLKDGIKIGEDAFPILDKSIKALAEYLKKQKLLQDDRKRLAETIEKAKEAIAYAQSKLDGLLKDKSKVEKRAETIIRQIKEAIERAKKGTIIPEFKASIKELEELSAAAEEIKDKAKIFDLKDIISKLDSAINDAKAEIQILKDKISKQDEAAQKEAIKKFAEELKDKVDKAIKKGEDAQTVEELEEAKKQIDTLKDVASEAAKEANKLNEPEAKAKIESQIQRLEEESKKLNKRIEEKKAKDAELQKELKELLEELEKAGADAKNAQSLNDLNKAIAELEAKISKGQALQQKLNQAKLTDEADTLKKALEKAAEILTDAKNRKDAENTRINELKNKLNNQKQDLESKTNNTKSKESISELENALSELNKSINNAETLNNDAKDDKSKESFKDEYNEFAKALADAKKQAQSSQQKLDALKQAKSELDRKVAEAISKANEAITEANNNKNSEDKDKLSSVLEQISKAKSELEKAKQDSETANDAENKKKCDDKLAELETAKAEIETQKTKVENKEKEIAKTKEEIRKQIEDLNEKIGKVDEAIKDKNKNNIDLTKKELDKEIQKAEELLEKIKDEGKLESEKIDLNSKITDAKNKSKAAEEALKNINKAEDDAKKAVEEAKQKLNKAIDDAKNVDPNKLDDLEEKQKQLDEAIEKGNKANKQADDAGVSDQTLKDKLAEAQTEKQKLEEKIKKAEADNINQIKQKIANVISVLDTAINKVDETTQTANKHDLEKTEEAITTITNALKSATDVKTETEGNKDKYQDEFNNLVSKITEAEEKQNAILKQKQDIESERKALDQEYETLKQDVDANILLFDNNTDKLDKVTEAIGKLEENLNSANALLAKTKDIKYTALQTTVEALITKINEKLVAARAKKQDLENAQEAEKQRIKKLKEDLNKAKQDLQDKSSALNNAQGLDKKTEALKDLNDAITKADKLISQVTEKDKLTNAKTEWEDFNSKLTEAKQLSRDKQDEINAKKQDLDNKINAIKRKVETASQSASQAISEKDKAKLQASKSELETLVNDLKELQKETEQEKYSAGTKQVTDELTKVNEQLKNVTDELNSETDRIKKVKEALEKATNDLKHAKQEATNNKDNVDKLEKALQDLQTQYGLANNAYTEHNKPENTKIPELQKALHDLKVELDTYQAFKKDLEDKNNETKKKLEKELENAKEKADKAINEADAAGNDKQKLDDAKKKLDDSKEELDKIAEDAGKNGYDKAKKDAEKKSKEIDKKLKDIISKLNDKTSEELDKLINELTQNNDSVKALDGVDELNDKLSPFEKLINDTRTSYTNLNTQENRNNNDINQKLNKLNDLLNESTQTYNAKNADLSSKKTATEEKYNEANNTASPLLTQSENLNGKSVEDLTKLITDLEDAKTKATEAKNLATTNKYSKYVTESDKLINKINEAIAKVTSAKNNLEGENKQAEKLIKEIEEKIKNIGDKKALITTDKKEKIDELETLISDLNNANSDGITFHNEKNKSENPLAKRPDVSAKLKELKDLTDGTTTELNQLRQKLSENKKAVEDAFNAAKNKEIQKRNSIDKAKVDKKIPSLEQALNDLREIKELADKAKELESQKGYAAKKGDIDALANKIDIEIQEFEELLKQAKQTEQERIQELVKKIQDQITNLNNVENATKGQFSTSGALKNQIEKLEKELTGANALKDKVQSETDGNLTEPKKNLSEAIASANATLELAKEKANAIEKIEKLSDLKVEEKTQFINEVNKAENKQKIDEIVAKAEAKNLQNKSTNIQKLKTEIEKHIEELNNKSKELEKGIGKLPLQDLSSLLDQISSKIENAQQFYNSNKDKYNELSQDFKGLKNSIDNANNVYKKVKSHVESGKQLIDIDLAKLTDELGKLTPKIIDTATLVEISDLISKLEQLESKVDELMGRCNTANYKTSEANKLKNDVLAAKEKAKTIKENLETYNSIKQQINNLTNISNKEKAKKLQELEANKTNKNKMNQILNETKELDAKYKKLREEFDNIKTEIPKLANDFDNQKQYQEKQISNITSDKDKINKSSGNSSLKVNEIQNSNTKLIQDKTKLEQTLQNNQIDFENDEIANIENKLKEISKEYERKKETLLDYKLKSLVNDAYYYYYIFAADESKFNILDKEYELIGNTGFYVKRTKLYSEANDILFNKVNLLKYNNHSSFETNENNYNTYKAKVEEIKNYYDSPYKKQVEYIDSLQKLVKEKEELLSNSFSDAKYQSAKDKYLQLTKELFDKPFVNKINEYQNIWDSRLKEDYEAIVNKILSQIDLIKYAEHIVFDYNGTNKSQTFASNVTSNLLKPRHLSNNHFDNSKYDIKINRIIPNDKDGFLYVEYELSLKSQPGISISAQDRSGAGYRTVIRDSALINSSFQYQIKENNFYKDVFDYDWLSLKINSGDKLANFQNICDFKFKANEGHKGERITINSVTHSSNKLKIVFHYEITYNNGTGNVTDRFTFYEWEFDFTALMEKNKTNAVRKIHNESRFLYKNSNSQIQSLASAIWKNRDNEKGNITVKNDKLHSVGNSKFALKYEIQDANDITGKLLIRVRYYYNNVEIQDTGNLSLIEGNCLTGPEWFKTHYKLDFTQEDFINNMIKYDSRYGTIFSGYLNINKFKQAKGWNKNEDLFWYFFQDKFTYHRNEVSKFARNLIGGDGPTTEFALNKANLRMDKNLNTHNVIIEWSSIWNVKAYFYDSIMNSHMMEQTFEIKSNLVDIGPIVQTMLITRIIYSNDSFGDVYSLRQLVRDASKKKPNGAPTGIVKLQDLVNNLFLNKYSRFPNDYTKVWQNAWNNRDEIQNDYKMVIDEYKQIRDYSGTGRWGSDETFEKSIHKFFDEDVYYPIK
ncbi:hypothetical protein [Metamycoplasma equirhinis]|uniref:hypothetical protein n=1 Tax=Metamycoplasma equirhinis TaxID=92402 RepID=UPI003593864B